MFCVCIIINIYYFPDHEESIDGDEGGSFSVSSLSLGKKKGKRRRNSHGIVIKTHQGRTPLFLFRGKQERGASRQVKQQMVIIKP